MPWGAVAAAVVGAYSASQSSKANKKGADGQAAASQAAIDEQRRQYDLSRADMAPWMQAGSGALAQMQALNGGDFSSFHESPDYKFSFGEGQRALDSGAAARGGLFGGAHSRDAIKYGQGMAEQQYGNYYNRLSTMAGQGQATASGLGTLGSTMATNIGAQYNNAAANRASAYNANANIWNNAGQQAVGAFGQWYGNNSARNGGGSGFYFGNNPGKG